MLHFRRHVMPDAASNRLIRSLTRLVAASIVTAGLALPPPASAQQTHTAASSGFQSEGIKATITSISLSDTKLILQFIIQNTRQSAVYLAVIGGNGGSAGTLMATNGAVYKMGDPTHTISGIPSCINARFPGSTDDSVAYCLKDFDQHDMTIVDAGQTAILGIIYIFDRSSPKPAGQNDNINFALKFLVRSAPGHEDTLSAAAADKAGPPSVVTITFPLIPLSQ